MGRCSQRGNERQNQVKPHRPSSGSGYSFKQLNSWKKIGTGTGKWLETMVQAEGQIQRPLS